MYKIDLHEQKKNEQFHRAELKATHSFFQCGYWSSLFCGARHVTLPTASFRTPWCWPACWSVGPDAWHLTLLLPFHVYGWDVQEDKETQTQSFFFLLSQISVYFSLATHPANKKKTGFWQVAKKIISVETQADCQNTVMPDYYASTSVYQYLKSHPLSFIHQFY